LINRKARAASEIGSIAAQVRVGIPTKHIHRRILWARNDPKFDSLIVSKGAQLGLDSRKPINQFTTFQAVDELVYTYKNMGFNSPPSSMGDTSSIPGNKTYVKSNPQAHAEDYNTCTQRLEALGYDPRDAAVACQGALGNNNDNDNKSSSRSAALEIPSWVTIQQHHDIGYVGNIEENNTRSSYSRSRRKTLLSANISTDRDSQKPSFIVTKNLLWKGGL
jgi:hypothetical protein